MVDLTLAVDTGGSLLRGFYTLDSFCPRLILMEPEVSLVPKKSIEVYEDNNFTNPKPENSAWLEYQGKYRAVGWLARNRFSAGLQLKKRKFELALPKVLAMVGAIAHRHKLANGAKIRLGILLPWSEYRDRKTFQPLIAEVLTEFTFRGEKLSFILEDFKCLPEGGGVLTRGREPGSSIADLNPGTKIAVVMVGFRDVSVLILENGDMKGWTEPFSGFIRMVESVKSQASILNTDDEVAAAICKAGEEINSEALADLVETSDPAYRKMKISEIRAAIAVARDEYWMLLSQRLQLQVPHRIDEVILAGGTARYFMPKMNFLFSYSKKVNWCEHLEKQLQDKFKSIIFARSLQYRLTDPYGMFCFLCGTASQSELTNSLR